jgi:hypothetical protein
MDPELKKLMQDNLMIARQNNAVLKAIRRHQVIGIWGKVLFWAVIIVGSAYGTQVYLRPLMETALSAYSPLGMPTSAEIQKLIDSYQVGN